jgi:AcrR family transcriptional regulator
MPRVTAAHEQEVRARIVLASLRVFAELGYRRATMQDIVRESGLSVGAIYTYFKSKDELFLAGCDLTNDAGLGELAERLAAGATTAEKLSIGIGYFLDSIDAFGELPGMAPFVVQAWSEASKEPAVRETLIRRREQLVTVGQMLLREGIARGEIPAWIDVEAVATAYTAMLDGLILLRVEEGGGYRRREAERRALSVLQLLLAANSSSVPPDVATTPARTPSPRLVPAPPEG